MGTIKEKVETIRAQSCEEQNGALIFRGGQNSSIIAIVAAGKWLMVEKETEAR